MAETTAQEHDVSLVGRIQAALKGNQSPDLDFFLARTRRMDDDVTTEALRDSWHHGILAPLADVLLNVERQLTEQGKCHELVCDWGATYDLTTLGMVVAYRGVDLLCVVVRGDKDDIQKLYDKAADSKSDVNENALARLIECELEFTDRMQTLHGVRHHAACGFRKDSNDLWVDWDDLRRDILEHDVKQYK